VKEKSSAIAGAKFFQHFKKILPKIYKPIKGFE
jgi:hypothetical protein